MPITSERFAYKYGGQPTILPSIPMKYLLPLFLIQLLANKAMAALTVTVGYVLLCPATTSILSQIYPGVCGGTTTQYSTAPQSDVLLVYPETILSTLYWDLTTASAIISTLLRTSTGYRYTIMYNGVDCNGGDDYTWSTLNYYCATDDDAYVVIDSYVTVLIPTGVETSTITAVGEVSATTTTETVTVASTSTVLASFCPGSDGVVTQYTTGPTPGTSTITTCIATN